MHKFHYNPVWLNPHQNVTFRWFKHKVIWSRKLGSVCCVTPLLVDLSKAPNNNLACVSSDRNPSLAVLVDVCSSRAQGFFTAIPMYMLNVTILNPSAPQCYWAVGGS